MNPLTLVKRIQSINSKEADLGISDEASWHAKYRDSAYVFVGGIPYELIEDNLNGAQVLGGIIRVDHCSKHVKREEEDEETQRQKREARGVLRTFQRGECTRGASCKFSHDEKRAANIGWGHEEDRSSRWDHDKFDGMKKGETRYGDRGSFRSDDKEGRSRDIQHRNAR